MVLNEDDDVRDLVIIVKGHAYIEIFVEHVLDVPKVLTEVYYGKLGEGENTENVDRGVEHK